MNALTILVAALAAVGVLLVFVSLAGRSNVNARLERYAAAAPSEKDLKDPEAKQNLRDQIHNTIQERKAKHDRERAERDADTAEDDAVYAIDYAYAAIEEAEYAVLQAELARMQADDLESVS